MRTVQVGPPAEYNSRALPPGSSRTVAVNTQVSLPLFCVNLTERPGIYAGETGFAASTRPAPPARAGDAKLTKEDPHVGTEDISKGGAAAVHHRRMRAPPQSMKPRPFASTRECRMKKPLLLAIVTLAIVACESTVPTPAPAPESEPAPTTPAPTPTPEPEPTPPGGDEPPPVKVNPPPPATPASPPPPAAPQRAKMIKATLSVRSISPVIGGWGANVVIDIAWSSKPSNLSLEPAGYSNMWEHKSGDTIVRCRMVLSAFPEYRGHYPPSTEGTSICTPNDRRLLVRDWIEGYWNEIWAPFDGLVLTWNLE